MHNILLLRIPTRVFHVWILLNNKVEFGQLLQGLAVVVGQSHWVYFSELLKVASYIALPSLFMAKQVLFFFIDYYIK